MKAKTGFFQELQWDGTVADSWIRLISTFFFALTCVFIFLSHKTYQNNTALFAKQLQDKVISEQSFNVLMLQTKEYDWNVLLLLVSATVAPKVIQKFAEAKTGVNDTTETITKTATSEQAVKTTGVK